MPIIKSAKKSLKVSARQKKENDLVRAKVKSAIKGARISIASGAKDVDEKISVLYKELDIAAKKNIIHKNKARRLKSRIAKSIKQDKTTTTKTKAKPSTKKAKPTEKK